MIARCGVVGAAETLGVTQPAISRMIKSAEADLGLKLFEQIGRRLVPTEEAENLYSEIDPIIASFRSVQDHIVDLREGRVGMLRIVATPGLAHSIVPETLKTMLEQRPEMKMSLDIRRRENVIQLVRTNAADLGLGLMSTQSPDIISMPVGGGRIVCVCPATHPLADKVAVRPADFAGHRLITMTRGSPLHTLIKSAFTAEDEPLGWAVETPYSASACTFVKLGFGVALVDSYATFHTDMTDLVAVPFEPKLTFNAHLYRPRHKAMSKLTTHFVSMLTSSAS